VSSTPSVEGHIERVVVAGLKRPGKRAIGVLSVDRVVASVVLLTLLLSVFRINQYPAPWFDEGIHLQVAKNLAADGTYAARSADNTLDYAPVIGVGPTLLLPIAAVFELTGPSLAGGRSIPIIYLILATALLFVVSRSLFGQPAAFVTLAVLLAMPALDWIETGRQVLGEVPALAFLLAGGLLVQRSMSRQALIAGGIVLGLSLVTKGQYVLIVPATLIALAFVDLRWTRHRNLAWHATLFCTVVGTWAGWMTSLLLVIGEGDALHNIRLLRESSSGALLVLEPSRMTAAWKVVLGPGAIFIVVPAAIAGLVALRSAEGERRFAILAIWLFQAAWLGWFVTASIGWPRYVFAGLAINAIFAGYLIDRLQAQARAVVSDRTRSGSALAAAACVGFSLLLVAGGWRTLSPVVTSDEQDASHFAALLHSRIPKGATVNAWEPELSFLSDVAIQPPPPGSLSDVVNARWYGGQMPDFSRDLDGEFLVIGPFARWVGVYDGAAASSNWRQIESVGSYQLFQRLD